MQAERQVEAIKSITEYIYSDTKEVDNGIWLRVEAKETSAHNIDALHRLGEIMLQKGGAFEEVETGLFYLLIARESNFSIEEEFPKRFGNKSTFLI